MTRKKKNPKYLQERQAKMRIRKETYKRIKTRSRTEFTFAVRKSS